MFDQCRRARISSDIAAEFGNYDRLLDYSRAVTGSLFFVPAADAAAPEPASFAPHRDGSLKGVPS
ncbi:Dyp-type peroxidase domain-containing protein [Dyadobacter aurulentus]|uniref:Dyp-type peroxidase domain-containing protein n=1 Tax=Dyadobacter sp. UC 10 TaxID=2605428 RepID=UPI001CEDBBB0